VSHGLGRARSPELDPGRSVLAVPLGSTEQHGPHLPLDTDTTIATELCRRLATRIDHVIAAPAIPYGSAGEHAGFPGTLSIGTRALELLLVELVRSADNFAGVVLVNAHGGNTEAVRAAVTRLRSEGRRVLAWAPTGPPDDSHAGNTETSVMLALRPTDVDQAAAVPGNTEPLPAIIRQLRQDGVRPVSPTGVLGDPTTATATHGENILRAWTDNLVATVRWQSPLEP
jgi:mycofactocin system creatininase family protein